MKAGLIALGVLVAALPGTALAQSGTVMEGWERIAAKVFLGIDKDRMARLNAVDPRKPRAAPQVSDAVRNQLLGKPVPAAKTHLQNR